MSYVVGMARGLETHKAVVLQKTPQVNLVTSVNQSVTHQDRYANHFGMLQKSRRRIRYMELVRVSCYGKRESRRATSERATVKKQMSSAVYCNTSHDQNASFTLRTVLRRRQGRERWRRRVNLLAGAKSLISLAASVAEGTV